VLREGGRESEPQRSARAFGHEYFLPEQRRYDTPALTFAGTHYLIDIAASQFAAVKDRFENTVRSRSGWTKLSMKVT